MIEKAFHETNDIHFGQRRLLALRTICLGLLDEVRTVQFP
jgi:hypothetical protein